LAGFGVTVTDLAPNLPKPETQRSTIFSRVPVSFEANRGQAQRSFDYVSRGPGYSVMIGPGGFEVRTKQSGSAVTMSLAGSRAGAHAVPIDRLETRSNYLRGSNPAQWIRDVPHFRKVRYESVYAGVDMVYYGSDGQLECDFLIAPGGAPEAIAIEVG